MPKPAMPISALFHIPERFVRSAQLERDFHDQAALDDYIVTPDMAEAFSRVLDGLRPSAGRRAWRVTGDYGVGKSSFALVLAHLLSGRKTPGISRIADALGWDDSRGKLPPLWPILLTGSRTSMVSSVAHAISQSIHTRKPARGRVPRAHVALLEQADAVATSNDLDELQVLLEGFRAEAASEGAGVLLIVDELGKFLEHAAQSDGVEDVFILQRLAELAARSGKHPFLLLGLLHQGFHAYAEKLPTTARNEWEKVAGRFEEIVFDQPLAHTAALVAGALHLDSERLPGPLRQVATQMGNATSEMGWLSGGTSSAAGLDVARLYPLHPTLLPVLVRFFARFGQHERSLFGFLLSGEPFGLQTFAHQTVDPGTWYRLDEFYDYVRACFGHKLAGASYRSQWLRIVSTVDGVVAEDALELRLLKAVAILNLIDAEDLIPSERALQACFSPLGSKEISGALQSLSARGVLFRRGVTGGYRLWPNSSVNLELALEQAARANGPVEQVATSLIPFLNDDPIMARRHYVERGTMRYFEVRFCAAERLAEAVTCSPKADGVLVVALADSETGRRDALEALRSAEIAQREDIIISVPPSLAGLAPELFDLMQWMWVQENTPELVEDAYGSAEVSRQLGAARRALLARANRLVGVRSSDGPSNLFWRGTDIAPHLLAKGISSFLSHICDLTYPKAPQITNELLNRNILSSAAAAARMRVIERIFTSAEKADLGLDPDKAPPEKSIYLSVLKTGGVHIAQGDAFGVTLPEGDADRLQLAPALNRLLGLIYDGGGDRVPVARLFESLRAPPYGVRDGVSPLLLALVMRTNAHELAVYEHGTFLHRFGPSDFLRLIKGSHNFEIQHCLVAGVRLEVFDALIRSFASGETKPTIDLLDVVKPLCQFAAQLPDYTKKASGLSKETIAVRDVLLSAREPVTMLFESLPIACGLEPFAMNERDLDARAQRFADELKDRVDELRAAYGALLDRIINRTSCALDQDPGNFDRVALAMRASRVSLVAKDPRLRTFALRLRDPGLSDTAWAEALASYLTSKPPAKWLAGDEARFVEECGGLADLFRKTEAAAFTNPELVPTVNAVRLNLTRGDGEDLVRIVHSAKAGVDLLKEMDALSDRLPQDQSLRIELLAEMLWRELKSSPGAMDDKVIKQPHFPKASA